MIWPSVMVWTPLDPAKQRHEEGQGRTPKAPPEDTGRSTGEHTLPWVRNVLDKSGRGSAALQAKAEALECSDQRPLALRSSLLTPQSPRRASGEAGPGAPKGRAAASGVTADLLKRTCLSHEPRGRRRPILA